MRTPWHARIRAMERPDLLRFRMLVERGISSPDYRHVFRNEYENQFGYISEEKLVHHLQAIRQMIDERLGI